MAASELTPSAVEQLLASRERFMSFLSRRVGSREAAEEIFQSALLRSVEKASTLRDAERVEAWFYRLLRNAVVDHYRRRGAETRALGELAREGSLDPSFEREMEERICACVKEVLPTLKPEYADLLQQVDLSEAPLSEAADRQGITANNAGVRLHRARAALRARLVEVCGACTANGCLSCACRGRS